MADTNIADWLSKELENLEIATKFDGEKLPGLKFEENKITTITIDVSAPFEKWHDEVNQTYKAIIPCSLNGVKHLWWLNIKNPVYKDVVRELKAGNTTVKVLQVGKGQNTKYNLVKG